MVALPAALWNHRHVSERPRRADGTFLPRDAWSILSTRIHVAGDCWLWTGSIRARGSNGQGEPYGGITYEGRVWLVHRLVHTLLNGPIPKGMLVDHICRQTLCIRPAHLRAVTSKENAAGRDPEAVRQALARGLKTRWAA